MSNSEEQKSIPTSKIQRAMKFAGTGAKVGGNYLKHYTKKAFGSNATSEDLDVANASVIFEALGELKGSALKAAQMMSMDKHILPKAYVEQFAMAQYSAPPLSYPLVVKTFHEYFKQSPLEIFDEFSKEAVHAASMGQVHKARLNGKDLAVKIQYPGVGDSVESDLNMVKPIALKIMNANEEEVEAHFNEIKERLIEETDYTLELQRSMLLSEKCSALPNLSFPAYYPEYCSDRVLTMDWIESMPLKVFMNTNPSQELRNKVGQTIWDFYQYQVRVLHMFHADPHPGNFLIDANGKVTVIDFGCVKVLTTEFYNSYSRLLSSEWVHNDEKLLQVLKDLTLIFDTDTEKTKTYLFQFAAKTIRHITQPFFAETFDFGNDDFIQNIINRDELFELKKELLKSRQARGPKDAIYLNRTYFGIYSILNELKAVIKTNNFVS
jgi:predicted unusual protein kinase regulating ubiquinone biosynthesis (AarF/ABC1/UbiB family)